jgi:alanyl-tRNA synthetase
VGTGAPPVQAEQGSAAAASHKSAASLRVIADHSRAATFLISDGVLPSNEGRGYVLRKIIRRAITHGRLLGQTKPFLHEMVFAVRDLMQDAYPELKETTDRVSKVVHAEETRFAHTLDDGLRRLEADLDELRAIADGFDLRSLVQQGVDVLQYEIHEAVENSGNPGHVVDFEARRAAQISAGYRVPRTFVHWILETQGAQINMAVFESARASLGFGPAEDTDVENLVATHSRQNILSRTERIPIHWRAQDQHPVPAPSPPRYAGYKAFKLYDTFGLPRDFMQDACRDQGIAFDHAGFDAAMEEQRQRAKASWKGAAKQTANPAYQQLPKSEFEGYRQTRSENCEVLAIIHNGQGTQQLKPGDEGEIILDHTPFYAESGGQVGDRGWLYSDDHNTVVAEVKGCYYPIQGVRAHQVVMKSPPSAKNAEGWGTLRVGDKVDAVVNTDIRQATMRNHTATHLLQAGLREVLGKHVKQAGSLVAPNHLRFDFSHFTAVEDEELQDIEDLINKEVLRNTKIEVIENVPIDVAINEYHAMALFGEKYGDKVRVIKIGDFSTELCGGTHTAQTGEIGLIKILKEGSVSSGVRRVEAVTGEGSLQHFRQDHQLENVVASFVGPTLSQRTRKDGAPATGETSLSPAEALRAELDKKDAEIKRLERENDQLRMKSASASFSTANIADKIKDIRGVKVLAHRIDNLERPQMRTLVDQLRDKLGSGVVVLGSASNGNVCLIVGVTKDLTSRIQAGKVIAPVAQKVGGKGGGRPDLAEAGGKDPAALDAALGEVYGVVEGLLT